MHFLINYPCYPPPPFQKHTRTNHTYDFVKYSVGVKLIFQQHAHFADQKWTDYLPLVNYQLVIIATGPTYKVILPCPLHWASVYALNCMHFQDRICITHRLNLTCVNLGDIQCELKRKLRFNPKSLKIEQKNHDIVTSGWWHIYFSFIWYIGPFILGQGWLLSNHFCI